MPMLQPKSEKKSFYAFYFELKRKISFSQFSRSSLVQFSFTMRLKISRHVTSHELIKKYFNVKMSQMGLRSFYFPLRNLNMEYFSRIQISERYHNSIFQMFITKDISIELSLNWNRWQLSSVQRINQKRPKVSFTKLRKNLCDVLTTHAFLITSRNLQGVSIEKFHKLFSLPRKLHNLRQNFFSFRSCALRSTNV